MTTNSVYLARLTRWGSFAALIVALGLPAFAAQAGELVLKGRNVNYNVKAEWIEVGDVEGHVIGFFENAGVGFQDGEVATYTVKGTFDSIKGTGSHQGYVIKTFADGSTRTSKIRGTSKPAGKLRVGEGTFTLIDGTGRFAGITGGGTYTTTRYGNKMTVIDFEGKATVPD